SKEVKSVKILLNIQGIRTEIFNRHEFVKAAGLYGSCSKGTNTDSSDTDLWIKIEKTSNENLAQLTSELRKQMRNAKLLLLDEQKLQTIKKDDPLFYHSLFFGSVIVYGDENAV
ncbi:MAG TPA: nucleotidyltransferase domain-containing protein, partial [Syntrophorhabdales bacterium]|nr:nucleotidyltransferase domain-containing protein [Syntrophorhabdales bacterium]